MSKEVRFVKQLMDGLTAQAIRGDILPAVVHAVVALQNIKLRAIETERKVKETEELEARVKALEEQERRQQANGRRTTAWHRH